MSQAPGALSMRRAAGGLTGAVELQAGKALQWTGAGKGGHGQSIVTGGQNRWTQYLEKIDNHIETMDRIWVRSSHVWNGYPNNTLFLPHNVSQVPVILSPVVRWILRPLPM